MTSARSPRPLPPEPAGRTLPPTPTRSRPLSPSSLSSPSSAQRRVSAISAGRAPVASRLTRLEPVPESDSRTLLHDEPQLQGLRLTPTPTPTPMKIQGQKPAPLQLLGDQMRRRDSAPGLGLGQQRSRYFEHAFGTSRELAEQEEWVKNHSMVVAELKTSVFIHDETRFIVDLAQLLSRRYHRPTECITITLQHGACLYLAGTFEPAYTLTLHALPSQVQTVTNRRNLMLMQAHLETVLQVAPARGVVHFVGVPEECLGSGGKTVAGMLADVRERVAMGGAASIAGTATGAVVDAAAEESLEQRVQRRKTTRAFLRTKSDGPSSTIGGVLVRASAAAPGTTPAGPRPEPSAKPKSFTVDERTASQAHGEQTSHPHVGVQGTKEQKAANPRRAISVGHRKSLNFLQTFLHRSSTTGGRNTRDE